MARTWVALVSAAALAGCLAAGAGAAAQITPMPQSFCSPVFPSGGRPQLLIVSDFPVRAFEFHPTTVRMQAAIRFVLGRHGFRAGRFTVGYQACDDSNPEGSSGDLTKCAANAKAYAGNPSVIGVLGTWSSRCAAAEIPILGQAPGGPLSLVSASNTNVGLTHAAPGTDPGEPGRYYPTGKRNFVRVISADDVQGGADALLARKVGARDVFVLNDGSGYGLEVATGFQGAAPKVGLRIAGTGTWDPDRTSFEALARRVRAAGADGVFLGGNGCPTCVTLIRQLRGAVGPNEPLIVPDGFSPLGELAKAVGPAANGMYLSVPGQSFAGLSPLGREIARRFGPYRLGSGGPAYVAQALEVLLDAIGRSDGSRSSVTDNLFTTRVQGGILGSFGFDRNGDPSLNPVLIFRARDGRVRLDRVVDAPPP